MPIEIKDMIITVSIAEGNSAGQTAASGQSGSADKEELIKECVERVLEILQEKTER